ncbi:MAG: NAD(P)/FAD-dependent oxidoreductase [Pseudomonadales bacterium]|nr:NAD(P)/FAD-dependent oxidoreductase [Pseudomonadales bacterium]
MSSDPVNNSTTAPQPDPLNSLEFDLSALRRKYREERDRRLREDGENQFIHTTGEFSRFKDFDPYAKRMPRDRLTIETEILILGGGFAGLSVAGRLIEAGFHDIRLVDNAGDFGGTWYWNRYPGAQCDIDAYCYLPLLEETGYMPREKYSFAPEIQAHARRIAGHYGLYEKAIFHTSVTAMNWDEDHLVWNVTTDRGDDVRARCIVCGSGPGTTPKLPGIPGIDAFQGHSFHTSRWDFDYTGGDNQGNLFKLADKRVAVIGTGASAIQIVPHVGRHAKHLYVFQRTPSALNPRGNVPTDPDWAGSLAPGWQRTRQRNFNDVVAGLPFDVDLVNDGWTDMFRTLQNSLLAGNAAVVGQTPEQLALLSEIVDARKQNTVRDRIDAIVKDPQTAEALKPWYRTFCKRPCFNDEYLPTFNRPNVTLVDTSGRPGIERITSGGITANGVEYPVDCIIFATGFEFSSDYRHRMPFAVNGRGGRSLFDLWANGRRTLHGHSTHGVPNWFFIGNSQVGLSVNYTSMLDDQARLIGYILTQMRERGARVVEATADGEANWVAEIRDKAAGASLFLEECTPGYFNNEGQVKNARATLTGDSYAPGVNAFNALVSAWIEHGNCEGLAFK